MDTRLPVGCGAVFSEFPVLAPQFPRRREIRFQKDRHFTMAAEGIAW